MIFTGDGGSDYVGKPLDFCETKLSLGVIVIGGGILIEGGI